MVLTIIVISALIFLAVRLRTSKGRIGEHRVAHILSANFQKTDTG